MNNADTFTEAELTTLIAEWEAEQDAADEADRLAAMSDADREKALRALR